MRVEIKPVNVEVQATTKDYVERKVKKLNKFSSKITDVIVYLKEINNGHHDKLVEIKALVPDKTLIIEEKGSSFGEAIDLGIERMIRQVKRYKETHSR